MQDGSHSYVIDSVLTSVAHLLSQIFLRNHHDRCKAYDS